MALFSQRKGLKPVKSVMQIGDMDADLRNGLWNALVKFYWEDFPKSRYPDTYNPITREESLLLEAIWHSYFKKPVDTLGDYWNPIYKEIREYYFGCAWFEVYDLVEFMANPYQSQSYQDRSKNELFIDYCNAILEREVSGYRFVGGKITQITSETEISEIEKALDSPLEQVNIHLKTALDLLSNRKSPDYRNSIKESISAVEAICKLIAGDSNATLGKALKQIEIKNKLNIHPALREAFDKLYAYASNAEGIRHAMEQTPNLNSEDATYMLVSCSAFINYLVSKAGIKGF